MKAIRICAALLLAVLMLSGCAMNAPESRLTAEKASAQPRLDLSQSSVEVLPLETVQPYVLEIPTEPVPLAPVPEETVPAPATEAPVIPVTPEPAAAPAAPKHLTGEKAEAIALAHAGFTRDQVSRLYTEYEIDDGIPQFDVQFHEGRWEYEYEIHAETGAILSFDKDD